MFEKYSETNLCYFYDDHTSKSVSLDTCYQPNTVKSRMWALGLERFLSTFWWAYIRGAYIQGGLYSGFNGML